MGGTSSGLEAMVREERCEESNERRALRGEVLVFKQACMKSQHNTKQFWMRTPHTNTGEISTPWESFFTARNLAVAFLLTVAFSVVHDFALRAPYSCSSPSTSSTLAPKSCGPSRIDGVRVARRRCHRLDDLLQPRNLRTQEGGCRGLCIRRARDRRLRRRVMRTCSRCRGHRLLLLLHMRW